MELQQTLNTWLSQGISLNHIERCYLQAAIRQSGYDKKKAAHVLGVSHSSLYNKLQKLNFNLQDLRGSETSSSSSNAQKRLGQMIREARKKKKLGLKEFSYDAGFKTSSFISRVEHGTKLIPMHRVSQIAQLLDLSCEKLAQAILEARKERSQERVNRGHSV
jgi:transposase